MSSFQIGGKPAWQSDKVHNVNSLTLKRQLYFQPKIHRKPVITDKDRMVWKRDITPLIIECFEKWKTKELKKTSKDHWRWFHPQMPNSQVATLLLALRRRNGNLKKNNDSDQGSCDWPLKDLSLLEISHICDFLFIRKQSAHPPTQVLNSNAPLNRRSVIGSHSWVTPEQTLLLVESVTTTDNTNSTIEDDIWIPVDLDSFVVLEWTNTNNLAHDLAVILLTHLPSVFNRSSYIAPQIDRVKKTRQILGL